MPNPLKLGFFIQPVHPPTRAYADVLREDREAVVLADRLGYREAFIGEHLVDSAETITSSLAELFQTTPQNVTLHLKAVFAEGELAEAATCKDYLQVRSEGGREVSRQLRHYRLEAILA